MKNESRHLTSLQFKKKLIQEGDYASSVIVKHILLTALNVPTIIEEVAHKEVVDRVVVVAVVVEIAIIPILELIIVVTPITSMMMIQILILPLQQMLLLPQYGNTFTLLIRIRQLKLMESLLSFVLNVLAVKLEEWGFTIELILPLSIEEVGLTQLPLELKELKE